MAVSTIIPSAGRAVEIDFGTVTYNGGAFSDTRTISGITPDMKPIKIDCSNPSIFMDAIHVTTDTGTITLSCNNVQGTSTVKITLVFSSGTDRMFSSEYNALSARVDNACVGQSKLTWPSGMNTTNWSSASAYCAGGYEQIGDIVYFFLCLRSATAIAAGTSVVFNDGAFPKPKLGDYGSASIAVAVSSVRPSRYPYITANGGLSLNSQTTAISSGEQNYFSGTYLAAHEQ